MSINQAHLIHDHSNGRSSTRIHAPPGGKSSMGSSFGWGDDSQAESKPVQRRNPNASSFDGPPPSSSSAGFGDSGASSVKVHSAPGGNSSIIFGGPTEAAQPRAMASANQAPAPRAKKGEFVDNKIGWGVENYKPADTAAVYRPGRG